MGFKKNKLSLIFVVVLLILSIILAKNIYEFNDNMRKIEEQNNEKDKEEKLKEQIDKKENSKEEKLETISGIIIGCDKSKALTDVVMVLNYDPNTNKIKLISIPRDLKIEFNEEFKQVKENNSDINLIYSKLTEVYYYAGDDEEAIQSIKEIASIITDLDIDYYAKVDLKAFKEIVDLVGGVEFDVAERMYYKDPTQNLLINLQKGQQLLDGEHAEMLVRYRRYVWGDLERIKVQRQFFKALTEKILNIKNPVTIMSLVQNIYSNIETDFNLMDVMKYMNYIIKLDYSNLLNEENMMTIPAHPQKIGNIEYLIWDKEKSDEETKQLLNENSND